MNKFRLRTLETLKLTWRFYRLLIYSREINIGFIAALAAFVLRAVASGFLIPMSLTNLVNSLENKGVSSLDFSGDILNALLMLIASSIIFSTTEWLFKPFWNSITRGIVKAKVSLIGRVKGSSLSIEDAVGRIASDVDFVMWNIGGMYTTLVPNMLTAIVSLVTIFQLSPFLGIFAVIATPPALGIVEFYIKGAEEARQIERRFYSEQIHLVNEYFKGNGDRDRIARVLNMWNKGISKQIFMDRTYWSSTLAYSYAIPLVLTALGIHEVEHDKLPVGNLVGVIYASFNVYSPLINALWGICVLAQNLVPMRRIMQLAEEQPTQNAAIRGVNA